jgi:hypothetical protein
MSAQPTSRIVVAVFLLISLFTNTIQAKPMEMGVDPENLGRGTWIYVLSSATAKLGGNVESVNDVPSLMAFFKSSGLDWFAIKAATGGEEFPSKQNPQVTPRLIEAAHAAGLKIFPYTRSDGKDVPGEIAIAIKYNEMGADGFILDAESEWESYKLDNAHAKAIEVCEGIKAKFPNRFLGHAPLPIISKHSSFPYKEFGFYCDATMPQLYWKSIGVTPKRMVQWMDEEWRDWQRSLNGKWTGAIKPIAPIGQAWNPSNDKIVTKEEIFQFVAALNHDKNPVTPGGYKGVSYWRADLHSHKMWRAIEKARIGDASSTPENLLETSLEPEITSTRPGSLENPNDFILDDDSTNAVFSGSWSPGANADGRFGKSYFTTPATSDEIATAVFRPVIRSAGSYDVYIWYSSHSNRSQKAPWVVSCDRGMITNLVDQTANGGKWVLLGRNLPFSPGADNFVSVASNSGEKADRFIIADAVRFVRKEAIGTAAATPSTNTPAIASALPVENPNEIILDDKYANVTMVGKWYPGKRKQGRYGESHMCANTVSEAATATAYYRPTIQKSGIYDVYIWYSEGPGRSSRAPWVITYDGGVFTNKVDQTINGGDWYLLAANLRFSPGTNGVVTVSNNTGEDVQHIVIADAVRLVRKDVAKKSIGQ